MLMSHFSTYRLYTGQKHKYVFNVLYTSAYKKVMDNNVNLDLSFNEWHMSMEKTLKEPKRALLSNSMIVSNSNYHCQVKLDYICHFAICH